MPIPENVSRKTTYENSRLVEKQKQKNKIIENSSTNLDNLKKQIVQLNYYRFLFNHYKGDIKGPESLKTACLKSNVDIKSLQTFLGVKPDGIIGKETYGNFKGTIIEGLKYSYTGNNGEINQTNHQRNEAQKEIARLNSDEVGKDFANWLEINGPKNKPNGLCGPGVAKDINNAFFALYGIKDAFTAKNGRYGYNFGNLLKNPLNLNPRIGVEIVRIDYPSEAPIGSIVYYDGRANKNKYVGSNSGHVEIVGKTGYFFDGKANNPGGSASKISQTKNTPEEYVKKTGFTGVAFRLYLKGNTKVA